MKIKLKCKDGRKSQIVGRVEKSERGDFNASKQISVSLCTSNCELLCSDQLIIAPTTKEYFYINL